MEKLEQCRTKSNQGGFKHTMKKALATAALVFSAYFMSGDALAAPKPKPQQCSAEVVTLEGDYKEFSRTPDKKKLNVFVKTREEGKVLQVVLDGAFVEKLAKLDEKERSLVFKANGNMAFDAISGGKKKWFCVDEKKASELVGVTEGSSKETAPSVGPMDSKDNATLRKQVGDSLKNLKDAVSKMKGSKESKLALMQLSFAKVSLELYDSEMKKPAGSRESADKLRKKLMETASELKKVQSILEKGKEKSGERNITGTEGLDFDTPESTKPTAEDEKRIQKQIAESANASLKFAKKQLVASAKLIGKRKASEDDLKDARDALADAEKDILIAAGKLSSKKDVSAVMKTLAKAHEIVADENVTAKGLAKARRLLAAAAQSGNPNGLRAYKSSGMTEAQKEAVASIGTMGKELKAMEAKKPKVFDRKKTNEITKALKDQINGIYRNALKRDKSIAGTVMVSLELDEDGKVAKVNFESKEGDADMKRMLEDRKEETFQKMLESYRKLFIRLNFKPGKGDPDMIPIILNPGN